VITTVRELAALVGGRVVGNADAVVVGFAGIETAGPGQITFVAQEKWRAALKTTAAACVVVQEEDPACAAAQIVVADANLAFARLVATVSHRRALGAGGVDRAAHVHPDAKVDPTAAVRPGAVVAARAVVGPRTVVGANAYVGEGAVVGADCLLHAGCAVLDDVKVGDRCILHAGAVVGSDGFGFATDARGVHHKIPQVGTVVVEDDVEIGANACVDRARFDETRVGRGTKIDNLVQIGHNVAIGSNCLLVAHSGVAGSTVLGRNVVLGAMTGVTGHVKLGDGAQVAAMSGVSKDLDGGQGYLGVPAKPYREGLKVRALTQQLPELNERLKQALDRIARLEAKLAAAEGAPS